jgi:hypothetical protein
MEVNGMYRYTVDFAILINVKFPQTVSEVLQTAPDTVQQWCDDTFAHPPKQNINNTLHQKDIKTMKKIIQLSLQS